MKIGSLSLSRDFFQTARLTSTTSEVAFRISRTQEEGLTVSPLKTAKTSAKTSFSELHAHLPLRYVRTLHSTYVLYGGINAVRTVEVKNIATMNKGERVARECTVISIYCQPMLFCPYPQTKQINRHSAHLLGHSLASITYSIQQEYST